MNSAEIMREKQRKAELRKQGIDPDEQVKPQKTWDDSYLKKYQLDYGEEDVSNQEEEKKEETLEEAKMAPQQQNKGGQKKKNKNK